MPADDFARSMQRSASMPADMRVSIPPAPIALPMVGGMPYRYQMAPVPVATLNGPFQTSLPVAAYNSCSSSWIPPPLPPVPCELKSRLEALEMQLHSPKMETL